MIRRAVLDLQRKRIVQDTKTHAIRWVGLDEGTAELVRQHKARMAELGEVAGVAPRGCPRFSRRRCGSQGDGFSPNPIVPGLEATDGYHVHRTPEQFLQVILPMEEVEQRAARLELHEEVGVPSVGLRSDRQGAKQRDRNTVVSARDDPLGVAMCLNKFTQRRPACLNHDLDGTADLGPRWIHHLRVAGRLASGCHAQTGDRPPFSRRYVPRFAVRSLSPSPRAPLELRANGTTFSVPPLVRHGTGNRLVEPARIV